MKYGNTYLQSYFMIVTYIAVLSVYWQQATVFSGPIHSKLLLFFLENIFDQDLIHIFTTPQEISTRANLNLLFFSIMEKAYSTPRKERVSSSTYLPTYLPTYMHTYHGFRSKKVGTRWCIPNGGNCIDIKVLLSFLLSVITVFIFRSF